MKLLKQGERLPAIFNRFIASKLPHRRQAPQGRNLESTFMGYTHKVLPWRHVECGLHYQTFHWRRVNVNLKAFGAVWSTIPCYRAV